MQNEKYYTPELNEFHPDFRVKFLDQQDIESLGWKRHEKSIYECYHITISGNGFFLDVNTNKDGCIHIGTSLVDTLDPQKNPGLHLPRTMFYGTIKNISELKRLMKQLNITT